MPKLMFLIVDDSPDVRHVLKSILQSEHAHILLANDGLDALAVVQRLGRHINLIITDINMPRMDGLTFVGIVSELYPEVPVIFISSSLDSERLKQRERILLLQKPFLPQAILEAVREVLTARRDVDEIKARRIA